MNKWNRNSHGMAPWFLVNEHKQNSNKSSQVFLFKDLNPERKVKSGYLTVLKVTCLTCPHHLHIHEK